MKLSNYAKKLGITYRTAWNHFNKGLIPGAYQIPTGTIIVPDETLTIAVPDPSKRIHAQRGFGRRTNG